MTCPRLILLLCALLLSPVAAHAQQAPLKEGILGSWILTGVTSQTDDGTRREPFGPTPKGIIIFAPDGQFSLFQSTGNIPRLAGSDRARATAEEATAVMANSIAYYGTYTVDEAKREVLMTVQASTFANVATPGAQRRIVTDLTQSELAFSNPRTPGGLTLHTLWKRPSAP